MKKVFLKISQKFTGKDLCQSLFFNKLKTSGNFIKQEALARVFSYEFCEIFKNTFFIENLRWLLFVNMLSFGLSSVTSKVSVAGFEHVFVCCEGMNNHCSSSNP